jgi:hypothetical protein
MAKYGSTLEMMAAWHAYPIEQIVSLMWHHASMHYSALAHQKITFLHPQLSHPVMT